MCRRIAGDDCRRRTPTSPSHVLAGGAADNQTTTLQNTVLFSVRFCEYRHPSGKTLFHFSVRFCKYRHPSGGATEWSGGRGGLTLGVGRRRREPMIRRDP